jgi:protoporphyrinogen/coproporphyrinogen III oxidase
VSRHVVVVGGGIAGLAAAYELTGGATPSSDLTVTVLESDDRLGGKLRVVPLGDRTVDVGPDGVLARRPEAIALVGELGAADQLIPIGAQGAWVLARRRLRRLPAGLALGVPTRLGPREAVRLLGVAGAARAGVDLVAPRRAGRSPLPDRAIGPLVADKLGDRVVDVLVDPLVGGIHAGRVRDLSAAAVFPPLLAAAQQRGSLMRALQSSGGATTGDAGPTFVSLRDGIGTLPELVAGALAARGATVRTGTRALALRRGSPGATRWSVDTTGGTLGADAVVLAAPAADTAALLAPLDADAAGLLAGVDAAGVVVTTLRLNAADVSLPEVGTGVLVPGGSPGPDGPYLTTAVTFLDRKWPHLARDGEVLVRVSAGRVDDRRPFEVDDAALVEAVTNELDALLGHAAAPIESLVTRWPASFPQYRVNHLVRVEGIESATSALGGVAVAGASFRGVGVPACIASGRGAARAVRAWLAANA